MILRLREHYCATTEFLASIKHYGLKRESDGLIYQGSTYTREALEALGLPREGWTAVEVEVIRGRVTEKKPARVKEGPRQKQADS